MKTAKEYIEKMRSDKDFAAQMSEKVKALQEAGEKDLFAAISKAAQELGYEISPAQVKDINQVSEDISEEELGKLAGGAACLTAGLPDTGISVSNTGDIYAITCNN